MQFVTIYGTPVSVPALCVASIGLFAALVMCIAHVNLIIPAVFMATVFMAVAYNINCTVVGRCDVFAWGLAAALGLLLATGGGLSFWHWSRMTPNEMVSMINPAKLNDTEPARMVRSMVSRK
jgi:hypothetical protein